MLESFQVCDSDGRDFFRKKSLHDAFGMQRAQQYQMAFPYTLHEPPRTDFPSSWRLPIYTRSLMGSAPDLCSLRLRVLDSTLIGSQQHYAGQRVNTPVHLR